MFYEINQWRPCRINHKELKPGVKGLPDRDTGGFSDEDYLVIDRPAYFHGIIYKETGVLKELLALVTDYESGRLHQYPVEWIVFTDPEEEGSRYATTQS